MLDFHNISTGQSGHDRGVSPVIAVILMVAITVILAAVVGTFVLDISGSLTSTVPEATWSATEETNTFTLGGSYHASDTYFEAKEVYITHEGGEPVSGEDIKVTVNGEQAWRWSGSPDNYPNSWQSGDGRSYYLAPPAHPDVINTIYGSKSLTAGDTLRVTIGTSWPVDRGVNSPMDGHRLEAFDGALPPQWRSFNPGRDRKTIGNAGYKLKSGDTIRIVYSTAGSSQVLYEYEVN